MKIKMAAVNDTPGETGMLLIGADGSINLHGGSSIFSGDNQSRHTLLAQKNSDGTMNVYMVPRTGPNKGKMFLVMPSQSGGVEGQGWKMDNLSDGRTILSPSYKPNDTAYTPPSIIQPSFQNSLSSSKASEQINSSSSLQNCVSKSVENSPIAAVSQVVSSVPMTVVSNSVISTLSSPLENTSTVTNTPNTLCWSEKGKNFVLQFKNSKETTNCGIDNTAFVGIRPMWLFSHEEAANLGKNISKENNGSADPVSSGSEPNVNEDKQFTLSDKIIYPIISQVKKTNTIIKKKTTDGSTPGMSNIKLQAGLISPLTSAPVFKSDQTMTSSLSSSNTQLLQTPIKNVIAIPGKLTNNGKQILVYPRQTLPPNQANLNHNTLNNISLLPTSKSGATKVPSVIVPSFSVIPTSIPIPNVARPTSNHLLSKSRNGQYVIQACAENTVTRQNDILFKNVAQTSSIMTDTRTPAQTYTTASNALVENGSNGFVTPSNSFQKTSLQQQNASTFVNTKTVFPVYTMNLSSTNTCVTTSLSNSISKPNCSTVMSKSASSILQTVPESVREAPKIVHVDFSKEPQPKLSPMQVKKPVETAPEISQNDDDLSIRIDSVFSLISPEPEEDTDSSDETKTMTRDKSQVKSEYYTASEYNRLSSKNKSKCNKKPYGNLQKSVRKSENILDLMKNVKLSKEALLDPLLNSPTHVVLEQISPADYNARKKVKPCSRQCRERSIRRKERQKMKDLEYRIEALKTKIKVKKWKDLSKSEPRHESDKDSLKQCDFVDDIEMPQLEPALTACPILASEIEKDMPDIRNSPPSDSQITQNRLEYSNLSTEKSTPRLTVPKSSDMGKSTSLLAIPYQSSFDQTRVKIPCKLGDAPVSSTVKSILPHIPANLSVPLTQPSVKTVNILNNPQSSKPSSASAPLSILNNSTTMTSSNFISNPATSTSVNTKFYLIKVDDKSILIPAVNTGVQPRAYILDPRSQSNTKLVACQSKSSNASKQGGSDLRLVVPSGHTQNIKLTNTWSNPSSVDPNKIPTLLPVGPNKIPSVNANAKSISTTISNLATNENKSRSVSTFGNVLIKQEPETNGYGDEIIMPTIKKEKYRGYSDETPPESSKESLPKTINENSGKRLNEAHMSSNENKEHTDRKIPRIDIDKGQEEKAKETFKEERIKNLKDMLKKQEQALEELRRIRFSTTSPT